MFDLALHYGEGPVPLTGISERQAVSVSYLEQLMLPLRKAGLVTSVRGAQGGYLLAKTPEHITVGDVLTVLEGPLAPTDCVVEDGDEAQQCTPLNYCVTKVIYERIYESVLSVVDGITLSHMIDDYRENENQMLVHSICTCK